MEFISSIPLEFVEGVPHSKSNLIHFSIDEKQLLGDSEAVKKTFEIEGSFFRRTRQSDLESQSRWLQECPYIIAFFWRCHWKVHMDFKPARVLFR